MPLNSLRISLADYVQLSLQAGNIRSTSRLTYDIISQLHLPQNGYFMERSNFLVAIIMLILRSLAIIPG